LKVKEYSIYCIYNGGVPFYLSSYNNLTECKLQLYNMVELEKERGRPYYVHNDFFENEYPATVNGKYFCIKERYVSEWKNYSEKSEIKNNNVIFLNFTWH